MSDCVITDRQGIQSHDEPRWTALLAVFVAVVLQLFLPDSLIRALGNRRRIEKTGAFSHPGAPLQRIAVLLLVGPALAAV